MHRWVSEPMLTMIATRVPGATHMPTRTRRRSGVHVVDVAHSDLVAELRKAVAREGLTVDEFIRRGRSDELETDRLRDLWLRIGPAVR